MIQNYRRVSGSSNLPNVIFALLVANGVVFALQMLTFEPRYNIDMVSAYFALWPLDHRGDLFRIWQLASYGFLHGGVAHIAFNMFALWMFGRELENLMGSRRFLTYYMVCVVGAGVVQLVVRDFLNSTVPTVGASGGVFGILLAYGLAFPNRMVMLLFPPIPMRAKYFVILVGLFELYQPSVISVVSRDSSE